MVSISLKKFGTVLTGRPFGAQTYADLKKEVAEETVELDFSGVVSLGSSFGEEVLVPLAKNQNNKIIVHSANAPVKDCIDLIAADFNIQIEFL